MTAREPNIRVIIEYKKVGDTEWASRALRPEEYFEESPDDEPIDVDSVPRHNHGIDYLDLEPRDAQVVRLVIAGPPDGPSRTITETFWNEGKCRAIERVDSGAEPYWELILESLVVERPTIWSIFRFVRKDGAVVPAYHAFIRENPDGSQEETRIPTG